MHPAVKKVVPNPDISLTITFDNGEEGLLDMKPHLGFGVFKQLADYANFCEVGVAFDTVEWGCGIDLNPEFVYRQCTTKSPA